jgi:hypothetical protein
MRFGTDGYLMKGAFWEWERLLREWDDTRCDYFLWLAGSCFLSVRQRKAFRGVVYQATGRCTMSMYVRISTFAPVNT